MPQFAASVPMIPLGEEKRAAMSWCLPLVGVFDVPFIIFVVREGHVPELMEYTGDKFCVAEEGRTYTEDDLNLKGQVVEVSSGGDLVLRVEGPVPAGYTSGAILNVATSVEPNLEPIDAQVKALEDASTAIVFSDRKGCEKEGFSLKRTMLAHGTELDPRSPFYFVLNYHLMSVVPRDLQ